MNENPYQAPSSGGEAYGVLSGRREDVRSVAVYQKGILVCVLLNLLLFICRAGVAESMRVYIFIPYVLTGIAGLVYVVLLAMKVYGTGLGSCWAFWCSCHSST